MTPLSVDEDITTIYQEQKIRWMAEGIDPDDPMNLEMCFGQFIAIFKGLAAAWIVDKLKDKTNFGSPEGLLLAVRAEFEPADIQERLRDRVHNFRQRERSSGLDEYMAEFRVVMMRVVNLGETDKIGLRPRTKQELTYLQAGSITQAMESARRFERAFFAYDGLRDSKNQSRNDNRDNRRERHTQHNNDRKRERSLNSKNREERTDPQTKSKTFSDLAREKNLCFNCHDSGHSAGQCSEPKRNRNDRPKYFQINEISIQEEEEWSEIAINQVTEAVIGIYECVTTDKRAGELLVLSGVINGREARILSTAEQLVSFATHTLGTFTVVVEGFNGQSKQVVRKVQEVVRVGKHLFPALQMLEWDLGNKEYDCILGQSWFKQYNPVIDWRAGEIVELRPLSDTVATKLI
ncbi:hypothetical protein THRCLA_20933 [Thraustotheca clavata]|uniref:CCHC-type domain-containing protein n=1 Tax=Thraustotheca clavata TaxID=74557 RepID=A0A1W0A1S7_9STRA|nr:hypothetical protein THRCLA_20933 [Thraustotheca clavata]